MLEGELLKHDSDCWGAACVMVHLLTGHQIWYSQRHDPRERLWEQVKVLHMMMMMMMMMMMKYSISDQFYNYFLSIELEVYNILEVHNGDLN